MNYDELKVAVADRKSLRQIAKSSGKSYTTVRYWLKKFNLETKAKRGRSATELRCSCGETDSSMFYGKKRNICAKCDNNYTIERQRKTAQKIRTFMGGKCYCCAYSKFQVALSLHHLDPKEKDPTFRCIRGWSWKRILTELSKCRLVCMNCHTAIHAGLLSCS